MRYLKTYKLFESSNSIKSDLEDIFLEIKDGSGWFYWVSVDPVGSFYDVYISFGSEEPYHSNHNEFEDDEQYHSDYNEARLSEDLIETLERSIEYMSNLGWSYELQVCTEYSSDPSEDMCDVITIDDLEPGQWLQENEAIRIKFRKAKDLNEELDPSTYSSAANKLKQLGHLRRSTEMETYAKELKERERLKKIEQRHKDIKSFPPFHLKYYKSRWNAKTQSATEELLCEGMFYIEPSFPYDWFRDMMSDWEYDSKQYGLWLYLEFGTVPADEQTAQAWQTVKSKLSDEEYDDIYWANRLSVQLFKENEVVVTSNGKCHLECRESDIFVFGSRSEAMRFKKTLIESLEGKNTWGKNQWCSEGVKSSFEAFFQKDLEWRKRQKEKDEPALFDKESPEQPFKPEDMPKLINTVKTGLSINELYRN